MAQGLRGDVAFQFNGSDRNHAAELLFRLEEQRGVWRWSRWKTTSASISMGSSARNSSRAAARLFGKRIYLKSSTLTPLLKRPEGSGLITRVRDGNDERQVRLTAAGQRLRDDAEKIPGCVLHASGTTLEELGALQGSIDILRKALIKRLPTQAREA